MVWPTCGTHTMHKHSFNREPMMRVRSEVYAAERCCARLVLCCDEVGILVPLFDVVFLVRIVLCERVYTWPDANVCSWRPGIERRARGRQRRARCVAWQSWFSSPCLVRRVKNTIDVLRCSLLSWVRVQCWRSCKQCRYCCGTTKTAGGMDLEGRRSMGSPRGTGRGGCSGGTHTLSGQA